MRISTPGRGPGYYRQSPVCLALHTSLCNDGLFPSLAPAALLPSLHDRKHGQNVSFPACMVGNMSRPPEALHPYLQPLTECSFTTVTCCRF